MSCKSLRKTIIDGLIADAEGKIKRAKANVEVYLHSPVGIGEHPDVLEAIQQQLDVIAHEQERIDMIDKHFMLHNHV